jgi:hypothetical protein
MYRAIDRETCGPLLSHTITVNGSGRLMAGHNRRLGSLTNVIGEALRGFGLRSAERAGRRRQGRPGLQHTLRRSISVIGG